MLTTPPLGIASLSLGSFEHHSLPSKLAAAAHAGFSNIELFDLDWWSYRDSYATEHSLPPSTHDGDATSLAAASALGSLVQSYGLSISCWQPLRNFEGFLDEEDTRKSRAFAKGILDIMGPLGTSLLLCCTTSTPAPKTSGDLERCARDLAWLADEAASYSPPIRIMYEGLSFGAHRQRWQDAWEVVERADRPNLGLCLDSFNTLALEWADPYSPTGTLSSDVDEKLARNMEELVARVPGDKIYFFQVADGRRMNPPMQLPSDPSIPRIRPWSRGNRLFPLEKELGAYLPVDKFADAVMRTGYSGPWSLEVFNDSLADPSSDVPETHAQRAIKGLKAAVAQTYSRRSSASDRAVPTEAPQPPERRAISTWTLAILSLCPNLTTLDFPRVTRTDADALEAVLGTLDRIEELILGDGIAASDPWLIHLDADIQAEFGSARWTTHDLSRIITRWPLLTTINLGATPDQSTSSDSPITIPAGLKSFTVRFKKQHSISNDALDQWLGRSQSSLRHLSLDENQIGGNDGRTRPIEALRRLLTSYGSNLTSLHTTARDQHSLSPLPHFIPLLCPLLTSLHLGSRIVASPSNFLCLSALTHLRHLTLASVDYPAPSRQQLPTNGTSATDARFHTFPYVYDYALTLPSGTGGGAKGVAVNGFGVKSATKPTQADVSVLSSKSGCGSNVNIATSISAAEAAGLPAAASDGSLSMTWFQINAGSDGGGPGTAFIDTTGTGNSFKSLTITKNFADGGANSKVGFQHSII
ncbi:hypothetical protein RQP46_007213 [Phenoliferia psychrophenolica]